MSRMRPTTGATHVRAAIDLLRIQTTQVLALVPVIAAAVINTGYQYLLALDATQGESSWRWSDRAIYFLGLDYQDPSWWDVLLAGVVYVAPVMAIAILSAYVCERLFFMLRGVPVRRGFLLTALVLTLLMSPAASPLHVMLGMVFAVVFGKVVFGGDGKTFLNPALLGAAVIRISFPTALSGDPVWTGVNGYSGSGIFYAYHRDGAAAFAAGNMDWWSAFVGTTQGMIGTTSVLAVMLGAALLLWRQIVSWRLITAQVLGLILAVLACNAVGGGILDMPWHWHLVLGSFAFGAVFVATDPASSASTDAGRWVQGLLIGGLVVMIRTVNDSHPDGVVAALLLVSVVAPLIDHVVVWFNIKRRAGRKSGARQIPPL